MHTGAVLVLTKLSVCNVQSGTKEERCSTAGATLPWETWQPRQTSSAHFSDSCSLIRGHSLSYLLRLPFIHEPFPTANQPPLLSHQKIPLLTHSQSKSRSHKPKCSRGGLVMQRVDLVRGVPGASAFPISRRQLLPSSKQRWPPGTHLVFPCLSS